VYALRQADAGPRPSEICREMGVGEATFYLWKKKYGEAGVWADAQRQGPAGHLEERGELLAKAAKSISGTRGGPIPWRPSRVSTQESDRVYLHVFDWLENHLVIPNLPHKVLRQTCEPPASGFRPGDAGRAVFCNCRKASAIRFDAVIAIDLVPEKRQKFSTFPT